MNNYEEMNTKNRYRFSTTDALNYIDVPIMIMMQVMVVLFDETGMELATFLFNGTGSNNLDWFSKDRLLSSPYDDIDSEPQNYFSVEG